MKPSHTLETCSARACMLSRQKQNRNVTFHVIKSNTHFIVSDSPHIQTEFESKDYWIVRASYYNGLQGNIVCSYQNGTKQKYNHKPKLKKNGSNKQGRIEL